MKAQNAASKLRFLSQIIEWNDKIELRPSQANESRTTATKHEKSKSHGCKEKTEKGGKTTQAHKKPCAEYDQFEIVYDNTQLKPNADGSIKLANPNLANLKCDTLYHIGLSTGSHDLVKMFGNVRYVCTGGTPQRMAKELGQADQPLVHLSASAHRYSMFKVGPVLSVSHGMGVPSISILMHELIKLVHYARAKNVVFFRIGTSGGIGVEPGSLVITKQAVDEFARPFYELAS